MPNHCTNCGFDNPPGMRFCGNCGARLDEPAAASAPVLAPTAPGSMPGRSERFQQAGLEAVGQRRSVTVLFADLSGYTALSEQMDNEDVYFLIQEYLKLLAEIVYRYEGFVDKYTGDGLMALFGAPVAQENNAEMAIRAALEMHAALAKLSARLPGRAGVELYMRIGLHAGSVVVGSVGSNFQMNYTAIGDTVNLASRLEQAARPGAILVSESVYQRTRALFDFVRLPPMALKGISNLVQTFQVSGVRERPDSVRGLEGLRSPMVGREEELSRLQNTLAQLIDCSRGGMVFISGEAGLGKTRLVNELKALVKPEEVQIFEAHSLNYRRAVSYWMFLDLLRNILGVTPYTAESEVQSRLGERISRLLGERTGETLALLERVLNLRPSNPAAEERLSQLEADQLHQRIFLAFRDWLAAEASRMPLLLVLEDLHWADDASLELVQFLLDSTRDAAFLIYATTRPEAEGAVSRLVERAEKRLGDRFLSIQLQELSPDQSGRLLDQLLSMLTLPEQLRRDILQRSAGIPFYLEEILRMLIDQGVLRREGSQLRLSPAADLESLGVPDTIKGLILSRFDRLDPLQRQFLQVASAVGRRFSIGLVKTVLEPRDEQIFNALLPQLVDREFIQPVPDVPGSDFQFQHILVSDAIYSTLLSRNRSELHGRIGAAIEQLYGDRLDDQIDLLARHYAWSNRLDKALHFLLLAGQKAAANFLNEPARQYFQEALDLLPKVDHSPAQELEVHSGLGDALTFLGDYSGAREQFQAALDLAPRLPLGQQIQTRSNLQRKLGTTYQRQGDYDQALSCMNEALEAIMPLSSRYPVERARLLNEIGFIYMRRMQLDEAEDFFKRALWTVEASSQPGVVSSIYNRLGGVYFLKEDPKTASEYARRSLDLRIEAGDMAGVARMYNNLGMLEERQGNWDEAIQMFRQGAELNLELNDVEGTAEIYLNLGYILCEKGELVEARQLLEECLRTGKQIGHSYLTAQSCLNLSYLSLLEKDYAGAIEQARRSQEIFAELGATESMNDLLQVSGEAYLALGDLDGAEAASRAMLASIDGRAEDRAVALQRSRAQRLAGKIAHRKGELDEARRLLENSADPVVLRDNPLDLGRTLAELSRLAAEQGDPVSAGSYASQARAIFTQLGARIDLNAIG